MNIKTLFKSIAKTGVIMFCIVGALFGLLSLTVSPKETVTFHSADLTQLTKIITDYSKAGYTVTQTVAQPLTNTYGGRTSCSGDCSIVKGEILVVMTK